MRNTAFIGIISGILLTGPALADGGAALVIGNADYAHGPKAVAASADAKAVNDRLLDAGYDVTFGENLNRADMRAAFDAFSADAADADKLVVFYSGHALRMNDRTFLAPVDINPTGPVAVAYDATPLSVIMTILSTKPGAAVAFVDGAQLDGFNPSAMVEPGLADITAPKGVLVVSAAAPGWAIRRAGEGRSKFGRAIVDEFLAEDKLLSAALSTHKDDFWTDGALGANVVMAPEPTAKPTTLLPATDVASGDDPTDDIAQQIELAFWKSTEYAGTPADYEAYLNRYPNGLFADIARNRLADAGLVSTPTAVETPKATADDPAPTTTRKTARERAEEVETALGLTRAEKRSIQADLLELGHDPNGVDGLFGRGARAAIARWQRDADFADTGYLTAEQVAIIGADADALRAERDRERDRIAALDNQDATNREERDWNRARQINTVAGYRRYMNLYPDGVFIRDARRAIQDIEYAEEDEYWRDAERRDTASAYDAYLDIYPNGRYAATARNRLDRKISSVTDDRDDYEQAWRRTRRQDTPEAYGDYEKNYPQSPYASEARQRRIKMVAAQRRRVEDRLRLGTRDWRSIEQRLDHLGFHVGKIDGKPDIKLRKAIKAYRKSRGLRPHGFADQQFIDVLLRET